MVRLIWSLALVVSSRTARLLALLVWVGLTSAVPVAAADAPAEVALAAEPAEPAMTARGHHEQGRQQFVAGRYEAAIVEYRKAYELHGDPSYLLDIAEAYRALGVSEQAVFFYRRYLTTHPNPPNRPEVLAQIAVLAPPAPLPPRQPSYVAPPPAREAEASLTGGRAERERSVVGRWWFWTAVGVLAAAGATVAIVASNRRDDGVPASMLGNAKLF
jgi:tetratricopeptide (TPR) repeat protein